jgi:hypothetical protein
MKKLETGEKHKKEIEKKMKKHEMRRRILAEIFNFIYGPEPSTNRLDLLVNYPSLTFSSWHDQPML